MRRSGGEGWILAALLVVFVAAAVYYGQRGFENQQSNQPTTYSVGLGGLKALYQLYERQGFHVQRFERPYTRLPKDAGLLVIVEPTQRTPDQEEKDALRDWMENGGSVLLVASAQWRADEHGGVPLDDVAVESARQADSEVRPDSEDETFLRDVRTVHLSGATRLRDTNAKRENVTAVADAQGAALIYWTYEDGGTMVVAADSLGLSNRGLRNADNAVLYVNIASDLTQKRPLILFDEFHQGFGSETTGRRSLWQALGAPVRAAFLYGVLLFLLVLYNANCRFGAAKQLSPPSRPSTDYISSMAGLFRRAGAPGIAVETTYRAFVRDLAARVEAPPDADAGRIAEMAAQQLGWDLTALRETIQQCERVLEGDGIGEAEALKVARQLQRWRRDAQLDRLAAQGGA